MDAIRVENLHRAFGVVQALDGLNLRVAKSSVFGFLGPNGAGKTTTIRILTGLLRPDSGRVWISGLALAEHRRAIARRIGYLPEAPAFYSWQTPREFLDYVGAVFALPAAERSARTQFLLDLVDLADVAGRRIGGFSRGMRQRLGIAQALVNRPEVLFLDEPTSALDPVGRKELLDLIGRLRDQSTIFMSTHILADVERVCDTVGIVDKGRLLVADKRERLIARYAIPAFDLEFEAGQQAAGAQWAGMLRQLPWVSHVVARDSSVRVIVEDVALAKKKLLPLAWQAGLTPVRYEMVKPSLEDVFLRLLGKGESAA